MGKQRRSSGPDDWLVELIRAGSSARATGSRAWLVRVSRRPWPIVMAVVLVLTLASATILLVSSRARGVDHPDRWDSRVAPFVGIVEKERGLRFDHPVYVDFLTPKQFLEGSTRADLDTIGQDHAAIEATAGLMQALGVVPGDLDLYNASGQLRGTSVALGSYSPTSQHIRLRGTELTPALRATLVHELAHALQDQHVDIAARMADLDGMAERQSALRALLEGDADRVETAWRSTLDMADREAVDADLLRQQPRTGGSSHLPSSIKTLVAAPEELGGPLVSVALGTRGEHAVEDLFLTPPTTQEHLLDPWSLVQDHQGSLAVATPTLEPDEQPGQKGTFGAVSWLVLLASRLPPEDAYAAARGWGGDAYLAFERQGTDCIKINYAADSPADRTRMRQALTRWIRKGPEASAQVVRQGLVLALEACAPSAPTDARDRSREALDLAVQHTEVSLALIRKGYDASAARCGTDRLLGRLEPGELSTMLTRPRRLAELVHPCLPDGSD